MAAWLLAACTVIDLVAALATSAVLGTLLPVTGSGGKETWPYGVRSGRLRASRAQVKAGDRCRRAP